MKMLIILGGIGVLVLGYLLWRYPHVIESEDQLAYFVRSLLLLCFLIPALFIRYEASHVLKYGSAWIGIFFVVFVGYSYHEDLGGVWDRLKSNLLPFSGIQHADGSISFTRAEGEHFLVEAFVNGIPIQFMVDTGATRIALTPQDAKRLGFDGNSLSYRDPIQTANGETLAAPVHLDELKIGTIVIKNLSASVTQNMAGRSLLGMNFLKKLKAVKIEGNRLTFNAPRVISLPPK
jgi:aspartyl protease family protein